MTSATALGKVGPRDITDQVVASFEPCPDERLRLVMQSLVRHLHGFVTEVGLTEEEWASAIGALTATGHITDQKRQEFILWSDTLGVSMLVDALAHPTPTGATESTVLGPFYVAGSTLREPGADIAEQEAGTPAWVDGRILDSKGGPRRRRARRLAERRQPAVRRTGRRRARASPARRLRTDEQGRFAFRAVRPVPYPVPADGPVGRMLPGPGAIRGGRPTSTSWSARPASPR